MSFNETMLYTKNKSVYSNDTSNVNSYLKEYSQLQTNYEIYEKFTKDILTFNKSITQLDLNIKRLEDEIETLKRILSIRITIQGSIVNINGFKPFIDMITIKAGKDSDYSYVDPLDTMYDSSLMRLIFQTNDAFINNEIKSLKDKKNNNNTDKNTTNTDKNTTNTDPILDKTIPLSCIDLKFNKYGRLTYTADMSCFVDNESNTLNTIQSKTITRFSSIKELFNKNNNNDKSPYVNIKIKSQTDGIINRLDLNIINPIECVFVINLIIEPF